MDTLPSPAKNGKSYTIYGLRDPCDLLIRYVGITCDPPARLRQHLMCDGSNSNKDEWIRNLRTIHLEPLMDVIEVVSDLKRARMREQHWISHYWACAIRFYNRNKAGTDLNEDMRKQAIERRDKWLSVVLDMPRGHQITKRLIAESQESSVTLQDFIKRIILLHYENDPWPEDGSSRSKLN